MPVYSHSRLSTFENCKLLYKYKYVDKETSELGSSIEAFMGSRVHDTLEKLYIDLKHCKKVSLDESLAYYEKIWEENWTDDVRIIKRQYTHENYKDIGKKCIANYYNKYSPFDNETTLATEIKVSISLDDNGDYKLKGYIDRLGMLKDGEYVIHDYKTSGHLPLQHQIDEDRQLALYQIGIHVMFPDSKEVTLKWHYLLFDKTMESRRSNEQLDELKKKTIKLIQEVEVEEKYPATVSALCNWCDYQNICPKWSHLYKVKELSSDEFLAEDGVQLVNKYHKLSDKKKSIDRELNEVKLNLLNYAEKDGSDMIFGSDVKARIWKKDTFKYPDTKDPERQKLEALLKASGKWDKVSRLDTFALQKLVDSGEFDGFLSAEIRRLGKKEKISRIYLSKLSNYEKKD